MNKKINSYLESYNYKLTEQRAAILDVMLKKKGEHLSAEEVLLEAKQILPNIGIATVYRTLEKLANMGILYKTMFDGGKYRYEISDDSDHHHHHFICLTCGSIIEIEEDWLTEIEEQLEKRGFRVVDHELKFYGYCPKCHNKK